MSKKRVEGSMQVRTYDVLRRAVEEGFRRGWNRAHKHTDSPTQEHVEDEVISTIMGDICEVFKFDDDEGR